MDESPWHGSQRQPSRDGDHVDSVTVRSSSAYALSTDNVVATEPVDALSFLIPTNAIFRLLIAVVSLLTIASLTAHAITTDAVGSFFTTDSNIVQLLNVDSERSLPVWYQTIMLAVCGVLLIIIADAQRRSGHNRNAFYWAIISLMFLYVSTDEMQSIHEVAMEPVRSALGIESGFLYFAWVIPAIIVLIPVALGLLPFLRSLPPSTRTQFLISAVVFVSGAVGLEMVGAYFLTTFGVGSVQYVLTAHLEELMEMVGVAVFLRAVLQWMAECGGVITVLPATQGSKWPEAAPEATPTPAEVA